MTGIGDFIVYRITGYIELYLNPQAVRYIRVLLYFCILLLTLSQNLFHPFQNKWSLVLAYLLVSMFLTQPRTSFQEVRQPVYKQV